MKHICISSSIVARLTRISTGFVLMLAMVLTNIPLGFIVTIAKKFDDRNVVDLMWQAQRDSSVVDSFGVEQAHASAENTVDVTILDATDEFGPSPSVVFTSDQVGYVFYIDATAQDLAYSKTTNGGTNWSAAVVIDTAITGWTTLAVWYDQWTPGDTTGTRIHIAAADDAADDIYYTYLDTNGDTLKGSVVAAVPGSTTFTEASDGPPSITKGAGGALFISGNFTNTAGGKVYKSTDGAGNTWSDATPTSWSTVAIDQIQLLPLLTDNDIIAIKAQTADNTIRYRIYDEVGDTWDGAWSASIASLTENTTYDQWFSATIRKSTGDVYLAFANQTNNAANDIAFWSFDESARSGFSQGADLFTNDISVMMPAPLVDENTGDIYVSYLRGTLNSAMNVYYKKSTDGGASWGDESAKLNEFADDHKGVRTNLLSGSRLYVVWYNDDLNDIYGSTIMDGAEVSIDNALTDGTDEFGPSPSSVFISDQEGYVFYIDAGNDLVYRKTVDGGKNWLNPVIVNNVITGWTTLAVWYDQWTPGDTTGTRIHIAAADDAADDIYYTYLDTNGDTLKGSVVAAVPGSTTFTEASDGPPSITKGAGGALFISGNFTNTAGGKVYKSTDGAGNTWSDATPTSWSTVAIDQIQLLPLLTDNDIIAIKAQTADNTIRYRIYDEVGDTWDGAWSASIASLTENTTYDQWFSATIRKSTGDVYLAFANQTNNAANDIAFWSFDESARSGFSQGADLFTNDISVMMPAPLVDENTGDIYVSYLRGTLNSAMNVYYKKSTDGGASWGSESENLNKGVVDDFKTLRGNLLSEDRLYAVWYNDDLNDIYGSTVNDVYAWEQAAYRFFNSAASTDVGSALANQDIPGVLASGGDTFRLRMLLHNTGQAPINSASMKLQYAEKSGTCDTAFSGESYVDVTSSTDIAYDVANSPADGDALTSNASDPTLGNSVVNQTYEEANPFTNTQAIVPSGQDGKWDFALIDNGAPPGTSYCFRIVYTDGNLINQYSVIPEVSTASGGNSPPVASDVSIDSDAASVTLIESTTKDVVCVATVTDTDGYTDISSVTADLFRTSQTVSSGLDDNDHYQLSGDSQCVPSGGAGNSETYTCTFAVQYFADATDTGSPNAADDWTCRVMPSDSAGEGTSASDTIEVDSLFALEVTASIDYGSLDPDSDTGSTNQQVTVTNTGNRDMDPQVSGGDMVSGINSIAVGQQKYASAGFTYTSGGTTLSTTPATLDLALPQRTAAVVDALVYWGIGILDGTPGGGYAGTNTFTATSGI